MEKSLDCLEEKVSRNMDVTDDSVKIRKKTGGLQRKLPLSLHTSPGMERC